MHSLRQTIRWFLRGMPLNQHQQAALIAAVPPPAPRISPRKVTAGQLLLPQYANTREGIILRELMKDGCQPMYNRQTMYSLCRTLREHGHQVFEGHKEVSNVRACLRRSGLVLLSRRKIALGTKGVVLWLSDSQRQVLREEAARWGA